MKLDRLYKALKDGKTLIIEPCPAGAVKQWAGNRAAMYALPGLPEFSPETLLAALGVQPQAYDEWNREERAGVIQEILHSEDTFEEQGYESTTLLEYEGRTMQPIEFPSGTYLIKAEYLKPLSGTKEPLRYYLIKEKTAVLVLDGLFPVALIAPYLDAKNSISNTYNRLADGIRKATTTLKIDHPEYFETENKK